MYSLRERILIFFFIMALMASADALTDPRRQVAGERLSGGTRRADSMEAVAGEELPGDDRAVDLRVGRVEQELQRRRAVAG